MIFHTYFSVFTFFVLHFTGWLDCPAFGQEINCIIPSKVPLCESFNAYVPPGKRYSSKQVIHQQRVLGRRVCSPHFRLVSNVIEIILPWDVLMRERSLITMTCSTSIKTFT